MLKAQVRQEGSLAHITQAEGEAVKAIRRNWYRLSTWKPDKFRNNILFPFLKPET
jgi:hypothetical protein